MDFATYFTIEWQVIFSFEFYYRKLADYLLVDSSVHPVSWPDLVVYQSGQVYLFIYLMYQMHVQQIIGQRMQVR